MKAISTLTALLLSGCVSQVLPPKVPSSTLKIDQSISIKPHQPAVYSDSLRSAIAGTEIFSEVKPGTQEYSNAQVNRPVYGSAVIPFLTIISLGIIPFVVEEEFGESFTLHRRGNPYQIEATWRGNTVLGWAALPLNLSPDRLFGDPKQHPRFHAFLKYKIEEALTR